METLRLLYNRVRVWLLSIFTDRVKRIVIQDENGKEHEVTAVQTEEKVCDHARIYQVAPTLWKCDKCDDVYFQINYKVLLTRPDLVNFCETVADHLGAKLTDKDVPPQDQQ